MKIQKKLSLSFFGTLKVENLYKRVSQEAPFCWKLFKIVRPSAKDIRKDILIFQV